MGAFPEPSPAPARRTRAAGEELTLSHQHLPRLSVIALAGDVDRTSSAHLADYLTRVRRPGDHVVIDMSELTFCDSSGLHVLLACADTCAAEHANLHLAAATGPPARLLRITGVADHLPVHASVQQAIATVLAPPRS